MLAKFKIKMIQVIFKELANIVDTDEVAHYETPHLDQIY